MNPIYPTVLLRYALLGDALASGATGLLVAAGAGPLAGLLGLPRPLLLAAGLVLIPYALLVAWLGSRAAPPRRAVQAVVAANGLWALDSAALLAGGWVELTALGVAFVILQAAVVAGFALAQAYALSARGRGGAVPA